jgi:prepilin-type N-terminal cleavage/methylation domain-containing protein
MLNLRPKIKNLRSDPGFTLIELLAVIAVMAIVATVVIVNLNGQRAARDVRIAENQLVSNIRLIQGYTLSERTLPSGQTAQFYNLKFDLTKPSQYTIEAIYNVSSSPQLQDIQTIQLPPNIQLAAVNPIVIDRSPSNDYFPSGAGQFLQIPGSNGCALLAFAVPFAKVIFNGSCAPSSPGSLPYTIQPSDDYSKIINFQNNISCLSNGNPPACSASTDSIMSITLTDSGNTVSKTIIVNAVTGEISFN